MARGRGAKRPSDDQWVMVSWMGSCCTPVEVVKFTSIVPLKYGLVEPPPPELAEELEPQPVRICVIPIAATAKSKRRRRFARAPLKRRERANGSRSDGRKRPAHTMLERVRCNSVKEAGTVMVTAEVRAALLPVAVRDVGLNAQVKVAGRPVQLKVLKVPV